MPRAPPPWWVTRKLPLDGRAGTGAGACCRAGADADAPAALACQHAHHAAAGQSDPRSAAFPAVAVHTRACCCMRQWRVPADSRGAPSARAADWYEAVRLLQQQPSLATVMDEYGSFALHFAAMHRASPEVVTLLLRLNPGAASCFNKSKYLPIHYAAGNGAPPECVALIWHAYPAGAEQRNGANQTAMALATQQNRWDTPTWLCILAHDSFAPVSDTSRVLLRSAENLALLKDPKRMEELAKELQSHTIGRANQVRELTFVTQCRMACRRGGTLRLF